MQIPEIPAQRKFASAMCHAHSNAPQTAQDCGSYSFDARIKILAVIYCSYQYLSIDPKKSLPVKRPQTAQTCDAHNFCEKILSEMY